MGLTHVLGHHLLHAVVLPNLCTEVVLMVRATKGHYHYYSYYDYLEAGLN